MTLGLLYAERGERVYYYGMMDDFPTKKAHRMSELLSW